MAGHVIVRGSGHVMFSAPHNTLHFRKKRLRFAEPYTGKLCMMVNDINGCHYICKTENLNDDPNFDRKSLYKDDLVRYALDNDIRILFDLHQLSSKRKQAIEIGTGIGRNIDFDDDILGLVSDVFKGFDPVIIDGVYTGGASYTVCSTVHRLCEIPCVQVEINSGLFLEDGGMERVADTLSMLSMVCEDKVKVKRMKGR